MEEVLKACTPSYAYLAYVSSEAKVLWTLDYILYTQMEFLQSGLMYELYTIAAVVVGGTSLAGGSGKIFGTLIGAFIIAVIQNGLNLTGVEGYTQKVILGIVILGAVLFDMTKKRSWRLLQKIRLG